MFGALRFNARAAVIMKEHMEYDYHRFSREQKTLFKMMSEEARAHGGNEYDLVVNFMTTMVRSVDDLETHGQKLKKWIHAAAKLQPYMKIEHYKDILFDVLKEINRKVQ